MTDLKEIIGWTDNYNFHAHSQFCDGRDTMADIAAAAGEGGFRYFGFTPHSPVNIESSCNMSAGDMRAYLDEAARLRELHAGKMDILTSLEIDYLGPDWGPHIDYFQNLPLDYRLGSVHFVPNKQGKLFDCDGNYNHFAQVLHEGFAGDVRYVVEKYFEQVLMMIERGGFDLLGHFDKIADNASHAMPGIEDEGWFESYIDDIVGSVESSGLVVEINTKAFADKKRFFPSDRWWGKLIERGAVVAVDSDAHYASKVDSGRKEALQLLKELKNCK